MAILDSPYYSRQQSDAHYRKRFADQGAAKTASYSMSVWDAPHYNCTGGSIVQALPPTAVAGDEVELYLDATSGTNTLSATYNSSTVATLSVAGHKMPLRYNGTTWVKTEEKSLASEDLRYDAAGAASAAVTAHVAATDPHGDRAYAAGLATGSRGGALILARGLISESGPPGLYATGTSMSNGVIYLIAVGVIPGDVIGHIIVPISTGGTASDQAISLVGLYDAAGNRLAVSADQGHAWETNGVYSVALTAPYTVPSGNALYVAYLSSNSGTGPQMLRNASNTILNTAIGGNIRPWATGGTGQSTLPSTVTIAPASSNAYYAAIAA